MNLTAPKPANVHAQHTASEQNTLRHCVEQCNALHAWQLSCHICPTSDMNLTSKPASLHAEHTSNEQDMLKQCLEQCKELNLAIGKRKLILTDLPEKNEEVVSQHKQRFLPLAQQHVIHFGL